MTPQLWFMPGLPGIGAAQTGATRGRISTTAAGRAGLTTAIPVAGELAKALGPAAAGFIAPDPGLKLNMMALQA